MAADSTRNILLEIAATAEFKELKLLNAELKASIQNVADLRRMLKGDVGGGGLKSIAGGATDAQKSYNKLKGELQQVSAELDAMHKKMAQLPPSKVATTQKATAEGTSTHRAESYDLGEGLRAEVRLLNGKVVSIKKVDDAHKRALETEKKAANLRRGVVWQADRERANTFKKAQEETKRANDLRRGDVWKADQEHANAFKKAQAAAKRDAWQSDQEHANEWRKRKGLPWRERSSDQVHDRANIMNEQRDFGIARRMNQEKIADQRRADAAAGKSRAAERVDERRRVNAAAMDRSFDHERAIAMDKQFNQVRRLSNAREAFNQQRAQPGAVVKQGMVFNARTGNMERTLDLTNKLNGAHFRLNTTTGKVTGGFRALTAAQDKAGDSFGKILGKVAIWSLATGAIFGTVRAIKGAISSFAAIEKGTIAVARVTENFGQGMSGIGSGAKMLTSDILDMTVQYGQNADEAMRASVIYGRLGFSQKQIAEAMKYTMATANISGFSMEESAKGLSSMIQQFRLSAKDIPGLVDKLSLVDRLSSATMGDLMQAGSRAAGVWHAAGGSVEEFAALVGVVAQRTGRSGSEIGNAFKTMVNRLGRAETQKKLFDLAGISVRDEKGESKDPLRIFRELSQKTSTMASGVAREIEGETAGARQVNFLINALKGLPEIEKQIAAQAKSAGAALQQNAMYMEGLATKAGQLSAAWDRFAYTLVNGKASENMKWWLDTFKDLLGYLPKEAREAQERGRQEFTKPDRARVFLKSLEKTPQVGTPRLGSSLVEEELRRNQWELREHMGSGGNYRYSERAAALGGPEEQRKVRDEIKRKLDNIKREKEIAAAHAATPKTPAQLALEARAQQIKESQAAGARRGPAGLRTPESIADADPVSYLATVSFKQAQRSQVLEHQGQLEAIKSKLHEIELMSKIELRIEDEMAITSLDAMDKKLKIINAALVKMREADKEFPGLKDQNVDEQKDAIKRLEDERTKITESRPAEVILQNAKEQMKQRTAKRESKEFLAGRIARSSLSGKDETAGVRESLALLARNKASIVALKKEKEDLDAAPSRRSEKLVEGAEYLERQSEKKLNAITGIFEGPDETLSENDRKLINESQKLWDEAQRLKQDAAAVAPTDEEKTKALVIEKEIHDLKMRDAAMVGRVDRERVEAMIKIRENAQAAYESTRKALGQMSDVDLARTRITAGRFKRGELTQFGDEAYNMPVEMRKQFMDMEGLFPGMRLMPERNQESMPDDWFMRADRRGPNGDRPFAGIYDQATKDLTLSMNIGDAENKIDALGNSLVAYISSNMTQIWDDVIARIDAATKPPKTGSSQGAVRQ